MHRAFSWLFSEAENQELNDTNSRFPCFPSAFHGTGKKDWPFSFSIEENFMVQLSLLWSLDINRRPRSSTCIISHIGGSSQMMINGTNSYVDDDGAAERMNVVHLTQL